MDWWIGYRINYNIPTDTVHKYTYPDTHTSTYTHTFVPMYIQYQGHHSGKGIENRYQLTKRPPSRRPVDAHLPLCLSMTPCDTPLTGGIPVTLFFFACVLRVTVDITHLLPRLTSLQGMERYIIQAVHRRLLLLTDCLNFL